MCQVFNGESNTHFLHFSSFAVVVISEFNVAINNVSIIYNYETQSFYYIVPAQASYKQFTNT